MLPHHRLVPRTVAVLGALVTFSLVGMLSATAATSGDFSYVGHRGYPQSRFTENTIASFQNAYDHGAPAVETDVRLTSDVLFDYNSSALRPESRATLSDLAAGLLRS